MAYAFQPDPHQRVVRCFCCGEWVRMSATDLLYTGERADEERWCVGCIKDVDSHTKTITDPDYDSEDLDDLEDLEGDY